MLSTTAGAQASPVRLAAIVANNTGLLLDAAHSGWYGGFSVALSNLDDPSDRRALNTPVTVAITAAGASAVTPAPLDIADLEVVRGACDRAGFSRRQLSRVGQRRPAGSW
ncbi:hypothetical protein [Rhodanobacter lindaniclasticus]